MSAVPAHEFPAVLPLAVRRPAEVMFTPVIVNAVVFVVLKKTTKVLPVLFNRLVPLNVASFTRRSSCEVNALNCEARPARVVVFVVPSAWVVRPWSWLITLVTSAI